MIDSFSQEVFGRRQREVHIYSDVFQEKDVDAELTTMARSHITVPYHFEGIRHPLEGAYFVETLVQLAAGAREELRRALERVNHDDGKLHPDIIASHHHYKNTTMSALVNQAPRRGTKTNGEDFLVGITSEQDELYSVPPEGLRYVMSNIRALYRIPTQEYFGPREQFRSSAVIHRVRTDPSRLVPIFEGEEGEEREKKLETADLGQLLREQDHPLQHAFTDAFGNVRLRAADQQHMLERIHRLTNADGMVGIIVNGHRDSVHRAFVQHHGKPITSLREVPDGHLGIYKNSADPENQGSGYLEANTKWKNGRMGSVDTAHALFDEPEPGTPFELVKI